MRPKSLALLALAAGCGLIASIGISQVIDSNKKNAPAETMPIYVALHNINLGDPVDEGMISLQEWPKDKVPVGAIDNWELLENRRPRATIFAGEPILDGKLLPKGQSNDPISAIPKNHRLKTIMVDARRSAAGLLSPGDRVDIQLFVKRDQRNGIPHAFTKTILQNIRVFAVDQTVQRAANGEESRDVAKTVSVILTPTQANKVTLAENLGEISLIPRNPDDEKTVEDAELTSEDLFSSSTHGDRRTEQNADEPAPRADSPTASPSGPGFFGMLQGALSNAASAAQGIDAPTRRMKIIYPDKVDVVEFTASGEPIAPETNSGSSEVLAPPADLTGATDDTDNKTTEEATPNPFPFDLRRK